ncbi:hypothetical protein P261_00024 [Lachnospiraceae bacterium TWA4]|nr:hypothetical protein P261_00024 [Lachnospiraceae bacterium TWA4]
MDLEEMKKELKGDFTGSKKEYVLKLEQYRSLIYKHRSFLCTENNVVASVEQILIELLKNIQACKSKVNGEYRRVRMDINETSGQMILKYNDKGFDFMDVYKITSYGAPVKYDEEEKNLRCKL